MYFSISHFKTSEGGNMIHRISVFKTIILILVLISLTGLVGCSTDEAGTQVSGPTSVNSPPTSSTATQVIPGISDIFAKQTAATKEIKSCRAIIHLEMDFKSFTPSPENILITSDMRSDIDITNRLLKSTVSTNLSVSGNNEKMTQQIIASGDSVYFKDGEDGQWQQKEMQGSDLEALWGEQHEQLTGSKYSNMISPEGFVYTGKNSINGHACYVLQQPLDFQQILKMAPELVQQFQTTEGIAPADLAKILEDAELVCLIDEQTYFLREVRLTASVNQEIQGKKITGKVRQSCQYDAFNEPVSIQIPVIK
jgi:hypothetical protein